MKETIKEVNGLEINKIHLGDCTKLLKEVKSESIEFIITDPPFNVNLKYDNEFNDNDNLNDDVYSNWCLLWINELYRVLQKGRYAVIFTGDKKLFYVMKAIYKTPFLFHHFLKWYKPNCQRSLSGTVFFNRTELAFILSKEKPNINLIDRKTLYQDTLIYKNTTSNDKYNVVEHKARRPIELYKQIIKGFNGNLILDCFMGTGTTAIASKQLQKNFIGIEIDIKSVNIANKRLQQQQIFNYI